MKKSPELPQTQGFSFYHRRAHYPAFLPPLLTTHNLGLYHINEPNGVHVFIEKKMTARVTGQWTGVYKRSVGDYRVL
ncbi:MAG: hypothetical protein D3924_13040 [Candidatus Electrothrix sp. AR4]|nr:hypothetical protein [Candidatus Electrothrix sp. AR4]